MILIGDSLQQLKTLPDASVQCCVTSPPYWGLRQYFFDQAVVMRYNLSHDKKKEIAQELAALGIKPRIAPKS